jgi:hypothetical protein
VTTTCCWQLPPRGSFWIGSGDEEIDGLLLDPGNMPKTYEPLMGYPGTMRPGMTPENMPYQDLPISDDDPDPVPWPHFQEIQWHHRWPPPHINPDTMEDVIEKAGRWATPEQEAQFRAGARNTVRELQARAEAKTREWVITDDEVEPGEEDEEALETVAEEGDTFLDGRLVFGEDNLFGTLGSDADRALTERATSARARKADEAAAAAKANKQKDVDDDDGLDDFFLDLGLDLDLGEEPSDDDEDNSSRTAATTTTKAPAPRSRIRVGEVEEFVESDIAEEEMTPVSGGVTASIEIEDDEDELAVLGLGDDDDVTGGGSGGGGDGTVPLEEFDSDEFDTGTENFFDDGGFDLDDGGDYGGGDDEW